MVGFARRPYSDQAFRAHLEEGVQDFAGKSWNAGAWDAFSGRLHYFQGDLRVVDDFRRLNAYLEKLEGNEVGDRLYYLATAPAFYTSTVAHLGEANLHQGEGGARTLVVEKPFGQDLNSARELNRCLHAVFDESQVYRIDHYLGKETAQNILFFRFANTIFEPVWNRRYI